MADPAHGGWGELWRPPQRAPPRASFLWQAADSRQRKYLMAAVRCVMFLRGRIKGVRVDEKKAQAGPVWTNGLVCLKHCRPNFDPTQKRPNFDPDTRLSLIT